MNDSESVKSDFEKRAHSYEYDSKWITSEAINSIPRFYLSSLGSYGDLLDVGGGTGFLSQYLRKQFAFHSITVLDMSPSMLEIAKNRMPDAKIICDTIEHFAAENDVTYDILLARQILHYVDNEKEIIHVLRTLMKATGVLYIGQFVVPSVASDIWHESFIKQISSNRKRSFVQDHFLQLFRDEKFKILKIGFTPYEENTKSFYKRKTNQSLDYHALYQFAVSSLNEDVQKDLQVRITSDNLFFTVQFCHILLSL